MVKELRSFWGRMFTFQWKFGLALILLVCIPRFVLVLHANVTGNYSAIGIIMFTSALVPFLFLNKNGRKKIGICAPKNYSNWIGAFFSGLGISILLFFIGTFLYHHSFENWYIYIGQSYRIPPGIDPSHKLTMFLIMAVTGMTFSPIGEELFFRGIVHRAFANSFGQVKATLIDGLAFAITHVAHFGLVFINLHWQFYPIPAFLWVFSMFAVSVLFNFFKQKSQSLSGAIICHAAFNLGMIACIFYGF